MRATAPRREPAKVKARPARYSSELSGAGVCEFVCPEGGSQGLHGGPRSRPDSAAEGQPKGTLFRTVSSCLRPAGAPSVPGVGARPVSEMALTLWPV